MRYFNLAKNFRALMDDDGFTGCGRRWSLRALKAMTYLTWSSVQFCSLVVLSDPFGGSRGGK